DAIDNASISNPITRASAGGSVTEMDFSTPGESGKAVLSQKLVVDGDALLDGDVAKKVVLTVNSAGIPLNTNLATLDADLDRRGVTTLMLEPRLTGTQNLMGTGIDCERKHVAHDRKVVRVFL
ncbi:TPA: hypothetical protein ACGJRP_005920, partial [Pseudomonas aeruginosa]